MWTKLHQALSSTETFTDSPQGGKCHKPQFVIGGRHFTVIEAYTAHGFIARTIIEDAVTAQHFADFLLQQLAPLVVHGFHHLLLDNASLHKTAVVVNSLNQCSQNAVIFSPKYSPDLKPIELGLSNVKRLLRHNEDQATRNPVELISCLFN